MATNFKTFLKGINIDPNVGSTVTVKGDLAFNSTSSQLELFTASAEKLATDVNTLTLTNKSLDASTNTVTNISNASIASGAAIAYSKLNLTGNIVNADINASAAIVYSKLSLTGSILNADINASAAIVYSKLSLSNSIVNADINSAAAIVDSKLATISTAGKVSNSATTAVSTNTASTIVLRDGSGNFVAGTITAALTGTASGNTTYTANQHGVVLSGSGNAMVVIAPDASTTKVLTSGGSSADPTWQPVPAGVAVNSFVYANTPNGHGSTNNKIRRFSNTVSSNGSDITFADSAANGSTFTINTTGLYFFSYADNKNNGTQGTFGISINSAQLTTSIATITAANRLAITDSPQSLGYAEAEVLWYCTATDVIRPHTDGNPNVSDASFYFIARRVL